MTPGQLTSLIGLLFGLVLGLVALIYRGLDRRVTNIEAKDKTELLAQRVEQLGQILSKMEGRFEEWSHDDRDFHHRWRHDVFMPAINTINAALYPLPKQIEDLQARMSGVERALFERSRKRIEAELRNPAHRDDD